MKAVAVTPGHADPRLVDRAEPSVSAPTEIKLRVLEVGICGTDREEVAGGRAQAPPGGHELVIGHEMLGQVVEAGSAVSGIRPGSFGVLSVRRGCASCPACLADRSDMCFTGKYTERGIKGADGYQCEFVVDQAGHFVPVPEDLLDVAVLTEPMSVAQKAIEEAEAVQRSRLAFLDNLDNPLAGKKILVAGLGAVGLLAAFSLALRDTDLFGLDVVDEDNPRVKILKRIGAVYVDGRQSLPSAIAKQYGELDVVIEAAGVAHLEFDLIDSLGPNGVYVLTGLPGGDRPIQIDGASLVRQIVLDNQVIVGSVNASLSNFQTGVTALSRARQRWPDAVQAVITKRFPLEDFHAALTQRQPEEIKSVIRWGNRQRGGIR
jgi:threonine dehydrogenase-like Zn-dependent dehydrogenase